MGREEHKVEDHLRKEVSKLGGVTRKWVSPGRSGVPDQIIILNGVVWFVEVKVIGEFPRDSQMREMKRLEQAGANVTWVQGKVGVDEFIGRLKNG